MLLMKCLGVLRRGVVNKTEGRRVASDQADFAEYGPFFRRIERNPAHLMACHLGCRL